MKLIFQWLILYLVIAFLIAVTVLLVTKDWGIYLDGEAIGYS